MGIKQRRERERQEVKKAILDAARAIAIEDGWQALTIRKVADRIEYSAPMIYEYFENKEAILLELLRQGFQRLGAALRAANEGIDNSEVRLMRTVDAYWDFAFECPELYQVMHSLEGVTFTRFEAPLEAREAFDILMKTIENWTHAIQTNVKDIGDAADTIWGVLHGLISLTMTGRISEGQQYAKALMEQAVRALLIAWSLKKV